MCLFYVRFFRGGWGFTARLSVCGAQVGRRTAAADRPAGGLYEASGRCAASPQKILRRHRPRKRGVFSPASKYPSGEPRCSVLLEGWPVMTLRRPPCADNTTWPSGHASTASLPHYAVPGVFWALLDRLSIAKSACGMVGVYLVEQLPRLNADNATASVELLFRTTVLDV